MNLGNPGDTAEHIRLVRAALDLLRNATQPTLLDLREQTAAEL